MKKVLVTGAGGQLGRTIHKLFNKNNDGIHFIFYAKNELDITNQDMVNKVFKSHDFDYCINCAAYTNVEQAEKSPDLAFEINADGAKNIALACARTNTTLLHISTDYVFDGEKEDAYTIDDKTNPINEYGKSKELGEQYIAQVLNNYFIIRTSWLYAKEFGNNFYRTILKKCDTEEVLTITDAQKGCPTDTVDLARYIYDLVLNDESTYGIKHFCSGEVMTWYDFAARILEDNNLIDKINLVKGGNYRTFAKRPKNSVLCVTK